MRCSPYFSRVLRYSRNKPEKEELHLNLSFQPELEAQPGAAPRRAERVDAVRGEVSAGPARKAVVVHAGARDAYQVALALEEAGMLKTLVTDMFWPADGAWAERLKGQLPQGIERKLRSRSAPGLPAKRVTQRALSGVGGLLLDKAAFLPFGFRRWLTRASDGYLGRVAGDDRETVGILPGELQLLRL